MDYERKVKTHFELRMSRRRPVRGCPDSCVMVQKSNQTFEAFIHFLRCMLGVVASAKGGDGQLFTSMKVLKLDFNATMYDIASNNELLRSNFRKKM